MPITPLSKSLCVLAGGALGSYLRYVIAGSVQARTNGAFPNGTLLVNVTGAFAIALLMTVFLSHVDVNPLWKLFLTVGVLGGFTTFSTAAWESYQLFAAGNQWAGLFYIVESVLGGAAGIILGVGLGKIVS